MSLVQLNQYKGRAESRVLVCQPCICFNSLHLFIVYSFQNLNTVYSIKFDHTHTCISTYMKSSDAKASTM